MKPIIIFSLFSLLLVTFISCEKDDSDQKNKPVRIETETIFDREKLIGSNLYSQDEQGRLIELSQITNFKAGYYLSRYIYGKDVVICYEYLSERDTPSVIFNYLNVNGWVDSSVIMYNNVVEATAQYEYNADGYLVKSEMRFDTKEMFFFETYEIENGNRIKTISRDIFGTPEVTLFKTPIPIEPMFGFMRAQLLRQTDLNSPTHKSSHFFEEIDTVYYEHNDHVNTISQVNRGISWKGLPDKNLVSKVSIYSGEESFSYGYSYEYDEKDRVTKKYQSDGQGDIYTYTYAD